MPDEPTVRDHVEQLQRIFEELQKVKEHNDRVNWWEGWNIGLLITMLVTLIATIIALFFPPAALIGLALMLIEMIVLLITLIEKLYIIIILDPEDSKRIASLKEELEGKKIELEGLLETLNMG